MSGFDWNAFWATLVATIVGALVASFIGLAVARAERPQPYLRVDAVRPQGVWPYSDGRSIPVVVEVSNTGDGAAYDVEVQVDGGVYPSEPVRIAKLDSGASIQTTIVARMEGEEGVDIETGDVSDTRRVYWPSRARAMIRWQQPQRPKRKHLHTRPISSPFTGTPWEPRGTDS
jgi:hypothetical protein